MAKQDESSPLEKSRDKYCDFHQDCRHTTEACYEHRQQIELLLNQRKLRQLILDHGTYPTEGRGSHDSGGLLMRGSSLGGRKAYAREAHQHQICLAETLLAKKPRVIAATLSFFGKDPERVLYPHTDPLVVSLQISNFTMHCVLIDNGSSADILYLFAYEKLGVEEVHFKSTYGSLIGFAEEAIAPMGYVLLPVNLGTHPRVLTTMVNFLVSDPPKEAPAYNAIIGRTII